MILASFMSSWFASFFSSVPDFGVHPASNARPRLTWGLFLVLIIAGLLVVLGVPFVPLIGLAGLILVVCAWRYPLITFYVFVALAPLWGLVISIPTGGSGEGVLHGSIDVLLGEVVAATLIGAWALLLFFKRARRPGHEWRPWIPLLASYGALVAAHMLSALSAAAPDPSFVFKYALRPVFSIYLFAVLLPVNFIRSRRTLLVTLSIVVAVGVVFAFDGLRGLVFGGVDAAGIPRAQPLPMFGFPAPLGGNQHALAELLLFAFPAALALWSLLKSSPWIRYLRAATIFMICVTLLTFARTAWIVLLFEILFLLMTIWQPLGRRLLRMWPAILFGLAGIVLVLAILSARPAVQSSTDARAMVTDIGWHLFLGNPLLGVGAGTFVDRVGAVRAFSVDFGDPIDSHGVLQKVLAETGLLGLLAFLGVMLAIMRYLATMWRSLHPHSSEARAFAYLVTGVFGAFLYQLSSTSYWTPRLWFPVGLALAAGRVFLYAQSLRDPDFLPSSSTTKPIHV